MATKAEVLEAVRYGRQAGRMSGLSHRQCLGGPRPAALGSNLGFRS